MEGPSKAEITFEDRKDGSCGVAYVVQEPGETLMQTQILTLTETLIEICIFVSSAEHLRRNSQSLACGREKCPTQSEH